MRLLTQKDGDLSSYFDKIDDRESGFTNSSSKPMLIDSLTNEDDRCKIGANLPFKRNSPLTKPSGK